MTGISLNNATERQPPSAMLSSISLILELFARSTKPELM
jgi:hypothetical protein